MEEEVMTEHGGGPELLRRMLANWFGRDGGSIPAIPITDAPSPSDVARARELIREHGWDHLLAK
jgi:ABC-type metal ion transport system, periplasmic component/surface adhesin